MPRRVLRRIHLTLALSLGLLVALLGLSGSILVYGDALDRSLNPGLWEVPAAHRGGSGLDAVIKAVRTNGPEGRLRFIRLPAAPRTAYEAWVARESGRVRVYVAPDGTILGARGAQAGLIGFLDAFHTRLFAGGWLTHILGVTGFGALLAVVTGLIMWWPRGRGWRTALRVRLRGHWFKTVYDLHRAAGAVAAPLLLLSVVTALSLVYHETSKALLVATLGGPPRPALPRALDDPAGTVRPPSDLLAAARAAFPAHTATWVVPPARGRPMIVRLRAPGTSHPNGNTYAAIHPGTGAVLRRHAAAGASPGQAGANLRYPLHTGAALGVVGRPLMTGLGVVPGILMATGVVFWWRRRPARRPRRAAPATAAGASRGFTGPGCAGIVTRRPRQSKGD